MNEGSTLLKLFREEQAKNNHFGCLCPICEADMQTAYERFKMASIPALKKIIAEFDKEEPK